MPNLVNELAAETRMQRTPRRREHAGAHWRTQLLEPARAGCAHDDRFSHVFVTLFGFVNFSLSVSAAVFRESDTASCCFCYTPCRHGGLAKGKGLLFLLK